MEALRIVAMSMIILWHFNVHVMSEIPNANNFEWWEWMRQFLVYGVNIFVMISGYYGIKLRWRSVMALGVTILCFVAVNYILCFCFDVQGISLRSYLSKLLFPFSRSGYWFINCYWCLMLLAPMINIGLRNMTLAQLRTSVILLTVGCCYSGFIGGNSCNVDGYNVYNFIYIYIVGYYLSVEKFIDRYSSREYLILFLVVAILNCVAYWLSKSIIMKGYGYVGRYNFIFNVVASGALVVYFSRLSFASGIVNSIATASLGCYFLQDGLFGFSFLYDWQIRYVESHPGYYTVGMFIIFFIGFWTASYIITRFKDLWSGPMINAIIRAFPQRVKQSIW